MSEEQQVNAGKYPFNRKGFELNTAFVPENFSWQELEDSILTLKDSEILNVSHNFLITKCGGKIIAIDTTLQGREFNKSISSEAGKLIPPGSGNEFQTVKQNEELYEHTIISTVTPNTSLNDMMKSQGQRFGEMLGQYVDIALISHVDGDHVDFEVLRSMMETNKNLTVYGPPGWQKYVLQEHSSESEAKPKKYVLEEDIKNRMHDTNLTTQGEGFKNTEISWGKNGNQYSLKFYEVPHFGSPNTVEWSQGFALEGPDFRNLIISDTALSPEIIEVIKKNHKSDGKKEKITISSASIHPETIYGLGPRSIELVEWERDQVDEGLFHSAHLPLVALALTDGQAEVVATHKGFFYRGSNDRKYMRFKFPKPNTDEFDKWIDKLKTTVNTTLEKDHKNISKLGPLVFRRDGKIVNIPKLIRDVAIRIGFSSKIVNWIQQNGVPESVLDRIIMPTKNTKI